MQLKMMLYTSYQNCNHKFFKDKQGLALKDKQESAQYTNAPQHQKQKIPPKSKTYSKSDECASDITLEGNPSYVWHNEIS